MFSPPGAIRGPSGGRARLARNTHLSACCTAHKHAMRRRLHCAQQTPDHCLMPWCYIPLRHYITHKTGVSEIFKSCRFRNTDLRGHCHHHVIRSCPGASTKNNHSYRLQRQRSKTRSQVPGNNYDGVRDLKQRRILVG